VTVPAQPKVYHITHVDNLPGILAEGGLWSDAVMLVRSGPAEGIGMGQIKERRLALPVRCHPGDHVGDYVPFYFCPRSIMLYLVPEQKPGFIRHCRRPSTTAAAHVYLITNEFAVMNSTNENYSHLYRIADRPLPGVDRDAPYQKGQAARFLWRRSCSASCASKMAPRRWRLRATTARAT
jgi:hypothetical protein